MYLPGESLRPSPVEKKEEKNELVLFNHVLVNQCTFYYFFFFLILVKNKERTSCKQLW